MVTGAPSTLAWHANEGRILQQHLTLVKTSDWAIKFHKPLCPCQKHGIMDRITIRIDMKAQQVGAIMYNIDMARMENNLAVMGFMFASPALPPRTRFPLFPPVVRQVARCLLESPLPSSRSRLHQTALQLILHWKSSCPGKGRNKTKWARQTAAST